MNRRCPRWLRRRWLSRQPNESYNMDFHGNVPVETMGTWQGLMFYTLIVAQRWGLLNKPDDMQAVVSNAVLEDDELVEEGFVRLLPRAEGSPGFAFTDCTFNGCQVVVAAEILVGLINAALEIE